MPAKYAWIIDRDHLYEADPKIYGKSDARLMGPRDLDPAVEARIQRGEGDAFRMLDDDGELYYSGRIVGSYWGYEPLHDFGTPNAGATAIQYRGKSGRWEAL